MHSRLRSVALSKNIGAQYTNPVRDNASGRYGLVWQAHLARVFTGRTPAAFSTAIQYPNKAVATAPSQFIDFGGQHEIALGETIDLMCPNPDLGRPPSKADIRMMPLLFS